MISFRLFTSIVIILGLIWQRSGDLIKNSILIRSSFPDGYVAGGNYASDCTTVRDPKDKQEESLSSCEDETFWELHDDQGKIVERAVILSCDPGRRAWNTVMGPLRNPDPLGGLWLYVPEAKTKPTILDTRLATHKAHRIALKDYPSNHDFHPLGIEIWPSHAGNASNLYVVNHARAGTVIEHFVLSPSSPTEARHIRTLHSGHFHSANGLALTSPDAFYVSNDHLITRRMPIIGHFLPLIESVLGLPLGFVSHVTLNKHMSTDSTSPIAKATFAKLFIPFPNGVSVSSSGTEVAIASTSISKVLIYERDPSTNALKYEKDAVTVPFAPDNLHFSPSSNPSSGEEIIVAGHPNFPDITKVAGNVTGATSASWVVAIVPKEGQDRKRSRKFDMDAPVSTNSKIIMDGDNWTLHTLFQSNGKESEGGFPGSTTALRDPETRALYVAGLYANGGMMECKP
ncbi:arylesterase [Agrocybe pediades]|nr:arylesterase [Agrocybe pediades]